MPFIKNITSKNNEVFNNSILELVKSKNSTLFIKLCENADFIFPFLKEKIIKNFVKLINKEKLDNTFEFSKTYCADFEDLIVNSWLKFADEDLTDCILEIFDKGTDEQKTYAAKYFYYIKDPLALDYLKKEAFSNNEALRNNCAKTLKSFGDLECIEKMKKIASDKTKDDFEKFTAFSFISAYKDDDSINFILKEGKNSALKSAIYSNLLDNNSFDEIQKKASDDEIILLFSTIIEGYPEIIDLNTIEYYEIQKFIDHIIKIQSQYAKNSLIIAKNKFKEFINNDIYLYDLDKNLKSLLKDIFLYLDSLNLNVEEQSEEINCYNIPERYSLALDVIKEAKLKRCSETLASLINGQKLSLEQCAKTAQVLKELDCINLVDLTTIEKIENENIKALIKSLVQC